MGIGDENILLELALYVFEESSFRFGLKFDGPESENMNY